MKTILLLLSIILFHFSSIAQLGPLPVRWGKFLKEELEMKSYAEDTSASAVMLCKFGIVSFDGVRNEFQATYEVLIRIKILQRAGFKYGDISIPYYERNGTERFNDFKAHTINVDKDGKTIETEVSKDLVHDEDVNGYYHLRKFAFPDLREGSIIEYRYTIKSKDIFFLKKWNFQDEIPVKWSEYRTMIPELYRYSALIKGMEPMDHIEHGNSTGSMVTSSNTLNFNVDETGYVMKNVKALRKEPSSLNPSAYFSSLTLQLNYINIPGVLNRNIIKDWESLSEFVLEAEWFGKQIHSYGFSKDVVGMLCPSINDPKEKIKTLYNYVKDNFVWNGYHDFYVANLKNSFEKKTGNGTEINSILLCLLKDAGIEAYPVLISTRDNGELQRTYPIIEQFDHMVVKAKCDSIEFFLDAIDPLRPFFLPDDNDINISGFLVREKNPVWVNIQKNSISKSFINYSLVLDKEDNLKGKVSLSTNGYESINNKKAINEINVDNFMREILKTNLFNLKTDSTTITK
jgi:hypothetical protein